MVRRFFLIEQPEPGTWDLPDDLAHHLHKVLRSRPGERIELADGTGTLWEATIRSVSGGSVVAEVASPVSTGPEPGPQIHLGFALPKGHRAEWLFEHATEAGAHGLHPLVCERSAVRVDRHDRWTRQMRSAAGQSRRTHLPQLHPVAPIGDFLASAALPAERYIAVRDAPPLDRAQTESAVLLIGPEGGFTETEARAADASGFRARSLGPEVLRVETAALVGLVLLRRAQGTG